MSQQPINVGTEPGNQNDGDTLRDAFIKVNANFDQLFTVYPVTNTTLAHDNPNIDGTIAKALQDAGAAGGGTVLVGLGTFTCPSTTLVIPKNVSLRGVNRFSTTINVTGFQDGISIPNSPSGVESLRLQMPFANSGDGIVATTENIHLRDIAISGGTPSSWAINLDSVNVCEMRNVALGEIGITGLGVLRSNGIIFQNSTPDAKPFNHGDSTLSHIDIWLNSNNTTGIKFHGPDDREPLINNVLLNRVEIQGTGSSGGCIGVHIRNARRIVLLTTDLERLGTGILEEHGGNGPNFPTNNVYIGSFVLNSAASYLSSGIVRDRTFIGCDNIAPTPAGDSDTLIPRALWLNDGATRLREIGGVLQIDDGNNNNGVQLSVSSDSPQILPTGLGSTSQLSLGRQGTRGVECTPGVILSSQLAPISNPKEGTLASYNASVVGPNSGLYQYRQGTWVFIG